MQRYAAAWSARAYRGYSTKAAAAARVIPRPRDSIFKKYSREYEEEVSELRKLWRQEYLAKVKEEEAIRKAKASDEALYVAAYRAEKDKAMDQRRAEMAEKARAMREERHAVREAYREHRARLEAEARAKQAELVREQQAERRAFVDQDNMDAKITNAFHMPPMPVNKPIPSRR